MSLQNEHAIELLRATGYTVEYFPNRRNHWRVSFGMSEGLAPSLGLAIKRCLWACGEISNEVRELDGGIIDLQKPGVGPYSGDDEAFFLGGPFTAILTTRYAETPATNRQ